MGGKNNKELLLKVGADIIWEKGYNAASIQDITDAAGLPKGSFYNYFGSKEKFALEALTMYVEQGKKNVVDTELSPIEQIRSIFDYAEMMAMESDYKKDCYISVMCQTLANQPDHFRKEVLCAMDTIHEPIKNALEQLVAEGKLNPNTKVDELVMFIDSAWRGAMMNAKLLGNNRPIRIFKYYLLNKILV